MLAADSASPDWTVEPAGSKLPVILAFGAGGEQGAVFPHAALLRRVAGRGAEGISLIVLHDRAQAGFYRGVRGLGANIAEVVSAVSALIAGLEASEVLTFGEGIGGHAALVFGVLLGARRIVAVEPAAHLIDDLLFLYHDQRWQRALASLPDPTTARRYEVQALMARTRYEGRAYILYGTRREDDLEDVHLNVIHAQWIARSDRVTLCPFPDFRERALEGLIVRGLADEVLTRCFYETPPPPRHASAVCAKLGTPPILIDHGDPRYAVESGAVVHYVVAEDPSAERAGSTTADVGTAVRAWIARKLLLGTGMDELKQALVAKGVPEPVAMREIDLAVASPYVRGSRRARSRLAKRDWLLAVYRKLHRLHRASRTIPRFPPEIPDGPGKACK